MPALRSLTSLRRIDVVDARDYIAVAPYPEFARVAELASWRGEMDWDSVRQEAESKRTQLAIPRKFNFYSPNFHLFGFYCDVPYVPFDFLKGVRVSNAEDAKLLCLYFNSIAFISQAFAYREETQVRFPELREEDLVLLRGLDPGKLAAGDRASLLELFEELRRFDFPSLTVQLEMRDKNRVALDTSVLSMLGFERDEIESLLPSLYDALIREFKGTRGLRKGEFREY
jgi:hypothetical protein